MINKEKIKQFTFLLAVVMVCFPVAAHAYLDPGTGSMLLQILGVAFIAVGGVWVAFKGKIKALFSKNKGQKSPEKDDEEDGNPPTDA